MNALGSSPGLWLAPQHTLPDLSLSSKGTCWSLLHGGGSRGPERLSRMCRVTEWSGRGTRLQPPCQKPGQHRHRGLFRGDRGDAGVFSPRGWFSVSLVGGVTSLCSGLKPKCRADCPRVPRCALRQAPLTSSASGSPCRAPRSQREKLHLSRAS